MGTHLEAHTQRYIASGDFATFWLEFDAALRGDVLMARPLSLFIGSHPITPEELLAALEPPKAVVVAQPSPFPRDPRLRGYLERAGRDSDRAHTLNMIVVVLSILGGFIGALGFILSHLSR